MLKEGLATPEAIRIFRTLAAEKDNSLLVGGGNMSTRADSPRWLKDGTVSWAGGVDGSRPDSDISADQCAFATNATFRGGPAGPRSGFVRRPLTFTGQTEGPFSVPSGPS